MLGSFCQKRSLWETLTHGLRQIVARHYVLLIQAASNKPQASSFKRQAAQGASGKRQALRGKHQASSRKRQAQEPCVLHKVSRS